MKWIMGVTRITHSCNLPRWRIYFQFGGSASQFDINKVLRNYSKGSSNIYGGLDVGISIVPIIEDTTP